MFMHKVKTKLQSFYVNGAHETCQLATNKMSFYFIFYLFFYFIIIIIIYLFFIFFIFFYFLTK